MTSKLLKIVDSIDTIFDYTEADAAHALMAFFGIKTYFIAGGYFRDKLIGREFKDVDVFIPGTEPPSDNLNIIRYDIESALAVRYQDQLINLIKLNENVDLAGCLARMDIGICQVGLDRETGHLMGTQLYIDDIVNKTLTVTARPNNESDGGHLKRMIEKFPEHTVIEAYQQ